MNKETAKQLKEVEMWLNKKLDNGRYVDESFKSTYYTVYANGLNCIREFKEIKGIK